MKNRELNPEALLEEAVTALREEAAGAEVARQAAARVLERLRREAGARPEAASPEHIRSCADVQALIPAYLAGELPPARALLVEDHTRECIPCRKALKAARSGGRQRATRTAEPRPSSAPRWAWGALAAALTATLGLALFYLAGGLGGGEMAQVRSLDGQLFRLTGEQAVSLAPGDAVDAREVVRTARGSGAVLRLADGSLVEVRERSELSLAPRRDGTAIRVTRGGIIVEAAPQREGHLYVATDDCLVSVTGTIFAVSHGTKGSRVSVVEGEVRVAQGRDETVLRPGQQVATRPGMAAVPVEEEVAWSRDGERYVALLRELKALDRELTRALARTGLRYDSRLLSLVPAETAIYAAMPNVSSELAEMHRLFQERLAGNELLADWWRQHAAGESGFEGQLAELVERIASLGEHLGEEIVVAVDLDEEAEPESPLLLAEVTQPAAFAAVLAAEVERINAEAGGEPRLILVSDPSQVEAGDGEAVYLWLAGDLFAAALGPDRLVELAAVIADPGASPFNATAFHQRLLEAYTHGAQWLVGVDLGHILAREEDDDGALAFSGLSQVEVLIVERKAAGDEVVHTGAVLSFRGERRGALAWLAAPAPMGSLDFISADANFAAAFVVEEPAIILAQVFAFVEATDPGFREELERFESEHGVRVIDDLAAPLGGEMAFALDGPALPEPAWKVVAEVYDPVRLQQAVEWAVAEYNRQAEAAGQPPMGLAAEEAAGRTYHRLTLPEVGKEVHYTFDGGYLVAAPNRALVDRAIQVRDSRYGITDAPDFVALLPQDGYLDFSAMVFTSLGPLADSLLGAAEGLELTDEQRQAIDELDLGAPTLTCAYGEVDRIRLVSTGRGGLFGSRLGSLLGLGALAGLGS